MLVMLNYTARMAAAGGSDRQAGMARRSALRDARGAQGEHGRAGAALEDVFVQRDWSEWKGIFERSGITFGPIARPSDHLDCAQIAANGMLPEIEGTGGLRTVDSPIVLDGETKRAPRLAPAIGEHTRSILESFGFGDAAIDALVKSGAVA
jgi:crotonobetainyl-CoA:carnitine CoA-transferase CaiB-like acyl-CoA transferase